MKKTAEEMDEAAVDQRCWELRVAHKVLTALGIPPRLEDVQVKQLYQRTPQVAAYRVNVRVRASGPGEMAISQVNIAHSFFCHIDEAGSILRVNPEIERLYEREEEPYEVTAAEVVVE